MSTDSTELTFVRCPSCRSLVPAISTRCRMCGATLEASASVEGGDQEPRKSGRVRQRTMSEASAEMSSAVGQVREAPPVETSKAAPVVALTPQSIPEDLGDDDPLSDFIEEEEDLSEDEALEEEAPRSVAAASSRPTPPALDDEDDADSDDEDEEDDNVDLDAEDPLAAFTQPVAPVEPPKVTPTPPSSTPRVVVESGGRKGDRPSQLNFGGQKQSAASEGAGQGEPPKVQAPAPRPSNPEPRPTQEARPTPPQQQQNRQPQKESGQQQSRPAQQQAATPKQAPPASPANGAARGPGGSERSQQSGDRRPQLATPPPTAQREEPRQQPPSRSESRPEHSSPQRQVREEAPAQSAAARATQPSKSQPVAPFQPGAAKAPAQAGRLFGWLVNYSDPNGTAVEIREGKFFVTNRSVKPNDLVLDDSTISAPHALLNVSASGGMFVQDLMSERGVHVRRKGSDTYRREEETVSVTHGDWVRFGDLEFLISLIAYPGER